MRRVFSPKLLGFGVGLGVIVAVRQTKPALLRAGNHLAAVLLILRRTKTKKDIDPHALEACYFRLKLAQILDGTDPLKFGLERLCACGVDGLSVHAACVEITDLLDC